MSRAPQAWRTVLRPTCTGLVAALVLLPGTAWADVCDTARPDWDGSPATALDEALHLFASPPALALLLLTALAIRFRNAWAGLAVTAGWSIFVYRLVFAQGPAGVRQLGLSEGCIGSPALFIGLVTALSLGTILYTAPNDRAPRMDGKG